jgi:hypothetical protein
VDTIAKKRLGLVVSDVFENCCCSSFLCQLPATRYSYIEVMLISISSFFLLPLGLTHEPIDE